MNEDEKTNQEDVEGHGSGKTKTPPIAFPGARTEDSDEEDVEGHGNNKTNPIAFPV